MKNIRKLKQIYEKGISPEIRIPVPGTKEEKIRVFKKPQRLIILGCGYISQSLCRFAHDLEFSVVVVDDRASFANRSLFPDADQIVCNSFTNAINEICISDNDYVAIVTRGHKEDVTCLRKILASKRPMPAYLGLIGSRRRVTQLFEMLEKEGFDKKKLDQVHTPIGLPINAVTPNEIAISILAELIQEKNKKDKITTDLLSQTNVDPVFLESLDNEYEKVLAVVLSSKGSTPVKSGAIMTVNSFGKTYGTIGGGCGEYEVVMRAMKVFRDKKDCVTIVDMTNDVACEEGMVCGGIMEVGLYYIPGEKISVK